MEPNEDVEAAAWNSVGNRTNGRQTRASYYQSRLQAFEWQRFPGLAQVSTVAHACNPSYSGGRDQEDHEWRPTWGEGS
jgi:hypothetical protein